MDDNQRTIRSDAARRDFSGLLDLVEHHGEHVTISRYNTPAAVVVPLDWYERAQAGMAGPAGQEHGTR